MILDTNTLSVWAEGIKTVEEILGNANSILFPSIVLGEYFGIQQSHYHNRYIRWLNLTVRKLPKRDAEDLVKTNKFPINSMAAIQSFSITKSVKHDSP